MIDISNLDKAEVLMCLYNAAQPQGMGMLHFDPAPMTHAEAVKLLKQTKYFDYVKGRVLKVDLRGAELDPFLFDRDNGQGAARRALEELMTRPS